MRPADRAAVREMAALVQFFAAVAGLNAAEYAGLSAAMAQARDIVHVAESRARLHPLGPRAALRRFRRTEKRVIAVLSRTAAGGDFTRWLTCDGGRT